MRHRRVTLRIVLVLLVPVLLAPALQAAQQLEPPAARFLTPRTIAEVGITRVIPFELDAPAPADIERPATVTPPGVVEIVRPPRVLRDATLGYLRVRGLAPGSATIAVGGAQLAVRVVPRRSEVIDQLAPIRLVNPAPGAVLWGTVAVGVEVYEPTADEPEVGLRLSTGQQLTPTARSDARLGPHRRVIFELDADALPPGPLTLTAVVNPDTPAQLATDPVGVRIVRPDNLVVTEAEATHKVTRPERFRDDRAAIGRDPQASGGAYVSNAGSVPAVCVPLQVDEPGRYQMIVRAAGSLGGGALPTVGFVVDGQQYARTNGRLVRERWHRLAVGVPILLGAGDHVITPYFENDFYAPGLSDRNLRLDTVELLRVDPIRALAMPSLPGSVADQSASMGDAGMDAGGTDAAQAGAMDAMDAMAGGTTVGSGLLDDPDGARPVPLRVALIGVYDGLPIAGSLIVAGSCSADGVDPRANPARSPLITLEINSKPYATQRTVSPRFEVDAAAFSPGENTIRLIATLDSGLQSRTPIQRMTRVWSAGPGQAEPEHRPSRMMRFSVHDAGWDRASRRRITTDRSPSEGFAFDFHSPGTATLTLPDDLAGSFEVAIESRGQAYDGLPVASVELATGPDFKTTTSVGTVQVGTWWDSRAAGRVELAPGPKRLAVSFVNDKFDEGKGDRNLWFQAVVLREVAESVAADRGAPVIELLYPAEDQPVGLADAAVARLGDDRQIASVDVLIDEIPTGVGRQVAGRSGLVVLPVLGRGLEPGAHTLRIRAIDTAGNIGESRPVTIRVLGDGRAEATPYERAVFLLDRLGLGPDRRELAAILTMGQDAWLDDRLARPMDGAEATALATGLVRFANPQSTYDIPRRVLDHALRTPNPVRARFVLWTQNHFSTWIRKDQPQRKWDEHRTMARLGIAPFADLLLASATSPAMLRYLDQDRSYAGRLNENYAREIMELHTLGVDGGYTQEDVTTLASLLTGWRGATEGDGVSGGLTRSGRFRFDPALNDGAPMRLLGLALAETDRAGRYDRVRLALETLAGHPSTARFVARSLAEHYVADPPPEELVADLARVYLASDGDMASLLRTIAGHRAFWDQLDARRLAHPLDYALRLGRAAHYDNPWELGSFLDRSGTGLFDRPTPDGYPEQDASYSDSNALLQRWSLAQQAVWSLAQLVPEAWRYADNAGSRRWAQHTVDFIAIGLTGRVLGESSNEAVVEFLMQAPGSSNERVLQVAPLIAQMPEASLR